MLAADAQVDIRAGGASQLGGHPDELAHAGLVHLGKGIVFIDLFIVVRAQEFTRVVPGEAESHLGQIVGTEGEELRFPGDFVRSQGRPGDLDHGPDLVFQADSGFGDQSVRRRRHHVLDVFEFLHLAHQGDHDLRHQVPVGVLFVDIDGGFDHRFRLHLSDLREGHRETAASVAHHGIELMQGGDDVPDLLNGLALGRGQFFDILLLRGNELMKRRVQEADGHGITLHGLIDALEIALLHRLDLGQGSLALLHRVCADHLPEGLNAVRLEEHVLRPGEADALGAQLPGLSGVPGGVGVGAHLQPSVFVGPCHDAAEFAGDGGVHSGDDAVVDVPGGPVQGEPVSLPEGLAGQLKGPGFFVHPDLSAAGYAAFAHASGDHRSMGGHAAADGEYALRGLHSFDVVRGSLQPDQDHLGLGILLHGSLGVGGGEYDLSAGGSGRGAQALADGRGGLQGGCVKGGMEQRIQVAGVDHADGLFFVDHSLVHQIAGDLQGCLGGALAIPGLEHIEPSMLHGELHVLHILVMGFQDPANLFELPEGLGKFLLHLRDLHGGAHAGDHVLPLGIGQEFSEEAPFSRGGIPGEGHARAAVVTHIAEGHGLNVHRGAPGIGDIVIPPVHVGPGVIPASEYRLDGAVELFLGIGREILPQLRPVFILELLGKLLQVVRIQLDVVGDALFFLHFIDELLEILLAHFHDHVGIHLDESAVTVPGPAGVSGHAGDGGDDLLVQAEVQDGVHHSRHGRSGAGAHGNQQRILGITELFAGDLLQLEDIFVDLGADLGGDLSAVFIISGAGLRGDGEALGHRQTDVGHFRQVCPLASKELPHLCIAFREQIYILVSHSDSPFPYDLS